MGAKILSKFLTGGQLPTPNGAHGHRAPLLPCVYLEPQRLHYSADAYHSFSRARTSLEQLVLRRERERERRRREREEEREIFFDVISINEIFNT